MGSEMCIRDRVCRHDENTDWIVQLAARRPEDMRDGAALLASIGVDVVDINMGCPSKKVTGGQSGSALMRDLTLARSIIEAALEGAGDIPVTLKMRLGWDDGMLNAPELGKYAEEIGVQMITVHGRTRCQFYKGHADWAAIGSTVKEVSIPVIANGDIVDKKSAKLAKETSGSYGVMVGRATLGQPWLPGLIAGTLKSTPSIEEQLDSLCEQIDDSVDLYGERLGVRTARKHIAAAIDQVQLQIGKQFRRQARAEICQIDDAPTLKQAIKSLYARPAIELAA